MNTVVHTHLHPDHVGWNVTQDVAEPRPTFRRANYLVPRVDWEYFTAPSVLETAPYVRDSVVPLEALGVMELIEGEHTITPEISTVPTPGHTPGHVNVIISSQGQMGVVVGDVLHSKVQVQEPGWCSRADVDRERGLGAVRPCWSGSSRRALSWRRATSSQRSISAGWSGYRPPLLQVL